MKKRILLLSTITLTIGLAACVEPDDETTNTIEAIEPDEASIEEIDSSQEAEYIEWLEHAKSQYDSEQLDAASSTLATLLDKDLTEFETIQINAEALKEDIHYAQAEEARIVAGTSEEVSDYEEERQSAIIQEQYEAATGQTVTEATDEELSQWFSEREQKESNSEMTKEEAEDYAFEQFLDSGLLNAQDYIFFVDQANEDWVQIEVREEVEQDGVTWTTLTGMYRYNVNTDESQKLDSITGDYLTIN